MRNLTILPITADLVKDRLRARLFGKQIFTFERLASTNDFAKRLAKGGRNVGTIVIAEEQTRGRGRQSRPWHSPPGTGLWLTLILSPTIKRSDLGLIPLLSGVSVAQTLEQFGFQPSLKWPNDVLINGKKVCGILGESEFRYNELDVLIVGIGINVNQTATDLPNDIRDTATSLRQASGNPVDRLSLLISLIENFERNHSIFSNDRREALLEEWRKRCPFFGQNITVRNDQIYISGIFEAVDINGQLRLRTNDGNVEIVNAGEPLMNGPEKC